MVKTGRLFLFVFVVMIMMAGCRNHTQSFENDFLIKAGQSVITVGDYLNALEVAKAAYSHSDLVKQGTFRKLQLRLFSQLAEEIIMMEIAREKKIFISEAELNTKINQVKSDYPEGVFEEMLLENAMPFELWKETLSRRLLMEKVLSVELEPNIEITPEVIEAYYTKNKKNVELETTGDSKGKYSKLIKQIRLEKKQENYQAWIDKKKKDYSIEVNEKIWEKITGK